MPCASRWPWRLNSGAAACSRGCDALQYLLVYSTTVELPWHGPFEDDLGGALCASQPLSKSVKAAAEWMYSRGNERAAYGVSGLSSADSASVLLSLKSRVLHQSCFTCKRLAW